MSVDAAWTHLDLRAARVEDAAPIWRLVTRMGGLEANSCYAYVLLCSHFAATSVVAAAGDRIAGFVAAYRPPTRPDEVFVWQVGVAPEARGTGLGGRLLDALLDRPGCADARFVTATVSPDNVASQRLFVAFAARHGAPCERGPGFPAALFAQDHADEDLFRIGPLPRS